MNTLAEKKWQFLKQRFRRNGLCDNLGFISGKLLPKDYINICKNNGCHGDQ